MVILHFLPQPSNIFTQIYLPYLCDISQLCRLGLQISAGRFPHFRLWQPTISDVAAVNFPTPSCSDKSTTNNTQQGCLGVHQQMWNTRLVDCRTHLTLIFVIWYFLFLLTANMKSTAGKSAKYMSALHTFLGKWLFHPFHACIIKYFWSKSCSTKTVKAPETNVVRVNNAVCSEHPYYAVFSTQYTLLPKYSLVNELCSIQQYIVCTSYSRQSIPWWIMELVTFWMAFCGGLITSSNYFPPLH